MTALFLKLLNISITAGYIVIAVLIFRLILKKAPKRLRVILWGIAALRLVLPFSIESSFSLIPSRETVRVTDEVVIASGFEAVDQAVNPVIREVIRPEKESTAVPQTVTPGTVMPENELPAAETGIDRLSGTVRIVAYVWAAGVLLMICYAAVSTLKMKLTVREAVRYGKRVYVCDAVKTPFILGVIQPRIYLPYGLSGSDETLVLAHEEVHIRRGDHIWKPLGFLLLSIYWFNPLLWVGYIFLCRDIELACDEKVIGSLSRDEIADYSETLLRFNAPGNAVRACPVAFSETGVKGRIHSVLNYKKPAFWLITVAVVACIALSACFLTDPKRTEDESGKETESETETESMKEEFRDALTRDDRSFIDTAADTFRAVMADEEEHNRDRFPAVYPEGYGGYSVDSVTNTIDVYMTKITEDSKAVFEALLPEKYQPYLRFRECEFSWNEQVLKLEEMQKSLVQEGLELIWDFESEGSGSPAMPSLTVYTDGSYILPDDGERIAKRIRDMWEQTNAGRLYGIAVTERTAPGGEVSEAVNVNHQETAKAHDNDRLQARTDEYGFLLGDNFHGQEDTSSIFSDELLLTLKNYFDIYENDDISELCADQKLIKAWKEEYKTFKSRANEAYMDTEYESRHKERIIEGCPYVDDHLCFIVISYEFYIHYIRIEKKNNSWFITDDIGNGNFISPYGYNTESQYLSDAGEAFLSAARKLLGEAYDQIVDSNTLTEKELNLSMEKAKTGMLRDVFGIPETAGENTGDSGENGDNDYEILISDPKSTEQRIVDWMIVQRGCVPDRIPRVWACVCEKEGLLQKSSYQSDQIGQTSGMPGAYYCLVNPHGDLLSTYDGGTVNDGEYASFVDNGIDGWYGHVFEYGFEPYQ